MHASTGTGTGQPVPRVTLYVRDSDSPIWERARFLAAGNDESLSSLASEGLAIVVDRRERQLRIEEETGKRMEQVELNGVDLFDHDKPRRVRFVGARVSQQDNHTVYVTRGKQIVVKEHRAEALGVFESFDEFREQLEDALDPATLLEVAEALGEDFFEEID